MSYQPEVPLNSEIGPTREQIERRAYEIYVARGGEHGHDIADWIMAEQELIMLAKAAAAEPKRSRRQTSSRAESALTANFRSSSHDRNN
jgi:Protein of unknown function (DUF2934)